MAYFDWNTATKALIFLAKHSSDLKEILDQLPRDIEMPNIPLPTMGGHTWWITLTEYHGWRLQQNMFTHHARILDQTDRRIAWGSLEGMKLALDRLAEFADRDKK